MVAVIKSLPYNRHMKERNVSRAYPVIRVLSRTLLIVVPVIIIFTIVSIISLIEIRKQNNLAVESAVTIYQNELSHRLDAIEHFIQWTVVHDPILDDYSIDKHMGDYVAAGGDLRLRVSDMQYSTGKEFQYFFYWDEGDIFINASELTESYDTYKEIKSMVKGNVQSGSGVTTGFDWVPCTIGEKTYLYYLITYKHRTFVSLVSIEEILKPLDSLNLGTYGSIESGSLDGATFYKTAKGPSGIMKYYYNKLYFPGETVGLPFNLAIYSDMLGSYGKLFFLQVLIFLTALLLSLVMGGYILFTYKKVILPIKVFSNNLSKLDTLPSGKEELQQGPAMLDLTDSRMQELNQINDQFKNLIHEITRLRINVYEAELEQNKFLIHFLQQQIKPHFYLNCLTTIDSMVSLGDIDAAGKMLQFTSRYFRYLFQADKDFVPLSSELSHVEDYLNIQNMRLSEAIEYNVSVDTRHLQIQIPPLILITFAENIVKHADPAEGPLKIDISCSEKSPKSLASEEAALFKGESCFEICISDNGRGFSDEVLEKTQRGEELMSKGEHIGITNCIRRLSLLYNNGYSLKLRNGENGGAVVILRIPLRF